MAGERETGTGDTGTEDSDTATDEGTGTPVIELPSASTNDVGAPGPIDFAAGWYTYTGSALGPGGFSRVERHRDLAAGERDTRHWHVDYLLVQPGASIDCVVRTTGADVECAVSRRLDGDRVPEFDAPDCDYDSHLVYSPAVRCWRPSSEHTTTSTTHQVHD